LSSRSDQTAAAAALLGYAAAVVIQRLARERTAALPLLPVLAVGVDILYAAGLSFLLPLSAGTWALYAFAIGTAALGYGAVGAAAAAQAGDAPIRDIATGAGPLLLAVRERSRLAHAKASLDRVLGGVAALERDRVTTAVLAEVLSVTSAIAGPAAIVRLADGGMVAGDLSSHYALALLRDTTPPALVRNRAHGRTR